MRFKQFLEAKITSYDHEPAGTDDLVELIDRHCLQALRSAQAGDFIYRGTRSVRKSGVYNPGAGERKSQNTTNYYTTFLDTNPANKDFPMRSKSFIASTRRAKARQYAERGTMFTCFPFDDVKIGSVEDDDIWGTQLQFGEPFMRDFHLVDFNDFWDDLCDDVGKSPEKLKSLNDAMGMVRSAPVDKVINRLHREGMLHGVDRMKISDRDIVDKFIDELPKAYSYKRLGCKVATPDDIPQMAEVWFSGKCVMVTQDDMDDIREELGL